MKTSLIMVIICFCVGVSGFFIGLYYQEPVIITETKVKWKDKIVYRDYEKTPYPDLIKELSLYDTSKPILNIYQPASNIIKADAGLYKRAWSGEAKIKVKSTNNFNYYLSIGAICFVAGAVIMARIK